MTPAKCLVLLTLAGFSTFAAELRLQLTGKGPIARRIVRMQCDQRGPALGLPQGPFDVEYINGAGNSLAIVPIRGQSLIFANVVAGSGARYAAGNLIWWDAAGRGISLSIDSGPGKRTECRKLP